MIQVFLKTWRLTVKLDNNHTWVSSELYSSVMFWPTKHKPIFRRVLLRSPCGQSVHDEQDCHRCRSDPEVLPHVLPMELRLPATCDFGGIAERVDGTSTTLPRYSLYHAWKLLLGILTPPTVPKKLTKVMNILVQCDGKTLRPYPFSPKGFVDFRSCSFVTCHYS